MKFFAAKEKFWHRWGFWHYLNIGSGERINDVLNNAIDIVAKKFARVEHGHRHQLKSAEELLSPKLQ